MPRYIITGAVGFTEKCGCEHCLGHDHVREVRQVVEAADEDAAFGQALNQLAEAGIWLSGRFNWKRWKWRKGPYVGIAGEDVFMAAAGAPRLPLDRDEAA